MPKTLTQYRVFIGSPGGLDGERTSFNVTLLKYTRLNAQHRGILFHPVGWEDTLGGVGRPQALINQDLDQCDYAVFILHDRWGSPTGGDYTSGTEEEFAVAEGLYKANKIRNILIFFKKFDPRQLRDPGKQLQEVLIFKKRIEEGKQYLFRQYDASDEFAETLEGYLAHLLSDQEGTASGHSAAGLVTGRTTISSSVANSPPVVSPGFDY